MNLPLRLLCCSLVVGLTSFASTGCKEKPPDAKKAPEEKKGSEQKKPGDIVKEKVDGWLFATPNDDYHIVLKVDEGAKSARAEVRDESAKDPVAIKADSIQLTLKNGKAESIPLKAQGAKDGKTAIFTATHDRFAGKIDPDKIEMSVDIGGKNRIFSLDKEH